MLSRGELYQMHPHHRLQPGIYLLLCMTVCKINNFLFSSLSRQGRNISYCELYFGSDTDTLEGQLAV
jgi:hypothetical protein